MKTRKASAIERAQYAKTKPVYPLYGYIVVGTMRCAVEDLRGSWSKEDPQYEVMAPIGFIFAPEYTHSLLCDSLNDVTERCSYVHLEPCPAECNCR